MPKPVAIDQDVPGPLEALTLLKVDDQNQKIELATLEERKRRLEPILSGGEFRRLTSRARKLHKLLNKIGWNTLCLERNDIWGRYVDAKERYLRARDALRAAVAEELPKNELRPLYDRYRRAKSQAQAITIAGKEIQAQIAPFQTDYDRYAEAVQLIEAHHQALEFQREEEQNRKQFYAEAEWYETLLLGVFRNSARCHYLGRDHRGREYRSIPHFQKVSVDSDTIWYLLETSRKTTFGWRLLLPYNVHVEDLISEETLEDMRAATGRQVDVVRGKKSPAIWYVIHRLDSPDGLPLLVPYKRILGHYPAEKHNVLPFPIGVKAGRIAEWQYLGEQPHMLIGGSSQSGKSNLINVIVSTIITMNSPREVRLLLIDLKGGIELSHFDGVPHIIRTKIQDKEVGMIKEVAHLLPALENISRIMNKRFDRLAESKSKEILDYNAVMPDDRKMARIVLVFDEMATFLSLGKTTAAIHAILREITGKGRAVGIHCILCNQYTDVEAVPGFIKANLAIRITGAATSGGASMTTLNSQAAKNLPRHPGRMIMAIGAEEIAIQAAYISVPEIAEAVAQAKLFGEAPELDSFPAWEPAPEPEPVELTERRHLLLTILAALPESQTMSIRRLAEEAQLPHKTVHRELQGMAGLGYVGMIGGSYGIVTHGREALARAVPVSVDVPAEMSEVSDVPPDETVTVIAPEVGIESLEVEAVKAYVKITPAGSVHRNGYHPRSDRAACRPTGRDAGGLLPESVGVLLAGEGVEGSDREPALEV